MISTRTGGNPVSSGEASVYYRQGHLAHLRFAEYAALIAAADRTGHFGVGVLLESVLAHKLAFLN